jgi:ribosomal protein S18 acetylase RimI-like enzyme
MIRLLNENDWKIVKPWIFEIAKESFDVVIPEILENQIKIDYEKEPEGFIVSEDNNIINGLIWFQTNVIKKSAYINAIYIIPEYRGKGISDKLIKYLEKKCIEKKIDNIELSVTLTMTNAIKFYKRMGFEIKRYMMSKKL